MSETISEGLFEAIPIAGTRTQQSVIVEADVDEAFDSIRSADMSTSRSVRLLVGIRSLPLEVKNRLLGRPREPIIRHATISDLIGSGYWIVLSDHPPHELVLGLVMWDADVQRDGLTHARFRNPGPGAVRVGWSFRILPLQDHRSLIVTETRTAPADPKAARRFHLYWSLVSPFASLTRRRVLGMIAAEAARSRARHRQPQPIRLAT